MKKLLALAIMISSIVSRLGVAGVYAEPANTAGANDQRLTAAGWRSVRATWRQIMRDPSSLTRILIALLQL